MLSKLTKRELEVVKLVLQGNSIKEICDKLYLSISTVKSHLHSIYVKTGQNSLLKLVVTYYTSVLEQNSKQI